MEVERRRGSLQRALREAWAADATGWGGLPPEAAFERLRGVLGAVGLSYVRLKLGLLCRSFRGEPGDAFLLDVPRRPG